MAFAEAGDEPYPIPQQRPRALIPRLLDALGLPAITEPHIEDDLCHVQPQILDEVSAQLAIQSSHNVLAQRAFYQSLEAQRSDPNVWLVHYSTVRPHQGYRNMARRPIDRVDTRLECTKWETSLHPVILWAGAQQPRKSSRQMPGPRPCSPRRTTRTKPIEQHIVSCISVCLQRLIATRQ